MAKAKKRKAAKPPKEAGDLRAKLAAVGTYPVALGPAQTDGPHIAQARIQWYDARKEITNRHVKRSRIHDVERAQEQHSPTVDLTVDYPEGKNKVRRNPTRVRQSEVWRYNQLSGMQRQAETEMLFAYMVRTMGTHAAVSRYGRPAGGKGDDVLDRTADIEHAWIRWQGEALRRKIFTDVVVECLAEPKTLKDIERDQKLKSGKALEIYQAGLDLWAELRGWTRRTFNAPTPPLDKARVVDP